MTSKYSSYFVFNCGFPVLFSFGGFCLFPRHRIDEVGRDL